DAEPWLLNVRNGTLDLRSGRLRPHRAGDLLTKQAAASYHPEAEAPTWSTFLARVLPDLDVRTFVQRSLGYAATGIVAESLLWLAYGGGANGKTTLLGTVEAVLGDYAAPAAPDLLLAGRDQHPTALADLKGARLVLTSELDDGRRLAEATAKQLTGGDVIKARVMRGDFFSFAPTHHLWVQTNHRPGVRGTDTGIWRRLRLVPFEVTVPVSEQDPRLGEKLRTEAGGILAWLVQGCLDWQQHGLTEPLAVWHATADYRAEEDSIGTFLTDCCIEQEQATVSAADLYDAYRTWADANGERQLNQRRFGQQLTERNLERRKHGPQRRWSWFGLGLLGAVQQQLEVNP
ncbi:MAG: phage/plasmid primase, P4 family, partial [Acidimicrobiales bacterium]